MLLAVIFFVPLISWDGFIFFTTFTKAIFFTVIVEIACIFWLPEAWQRLKLYSKSLMTYSILIFFCILILTSLSGVNFYKSFWGNYERMMGVWMYGHLILFYLILITTIRSAEQWTKLFYTTAFSGFLVALIGFFEMFSKNAPIRAESTFENATFLAQYLLISFFILLLLLMHDKKIRFRSAFLITTLGFILLTTFFTASRGAFLGLATGSFLALTLFILLGGGLPEGTTLSLTHGLLKKVAIGLLMAIVLVGALGFIFRKQFASSPIYALRRLAISSFSEKTTASRLLLWKVSWNGWKERPVLGWGIENYNLLFNKYYDPKLFEQEGWFDRAHNFIFDIGTSTDLVGLVSYIGIFLTPLYLLIKSLKKKYLSFLNFTLFVALIVGYLIQNLFAFDILISLILLFTVFSYIHVTSGTSKITLKTNPKILPFAIGIGIMIPVFIIGTLMPLIENRLTNRAMYAFARGKNDEGKKNLEQALAYHTYGNIEARRIMAEYIFESFKEKEQKIRTPSPELIDYTIEKMDENIKEDSKNARWYVYQGRLYIQKALLSDSFSQENAKKAALILSEAVKLSPARYGTYLELAEARRIGGDVDGMWKAMDIAIGLLPEVSMSHSIALTHAIETRTIDRERREIEWLFSHINANDSYRDLLYNKNGDLQLARNTYFQTGRFQDAIDFEKKILDLVLPEKTMFIPKKDLATEYAWLAELYKKVGLYDEARTLALEVAKLDPEGREKEVELFLQTLQK